MSLSSRITRLGLDPPLPLHLLLLRKKQLLLSNLKPHLNPFKLLLPREVPALEIESSLPLSPRRSPQRKASTLLVSKAQAPTTASLSQMSSLLLSRLQKPLLPQRCPQDWLISRMFLSKIRKYPTLERLSLIDSATQSKISLITM
jgi:hypothetical protein